ncbi:ADP-ribosylglycohydrolase family protein [Paraglaciecola aestuariivivens]
MNTITGAILGDYVGSAYEGLDIKGFSLPLTVASSRITDDSIMTFATLHAISKNNSFKSSLRWFCRKYPAVGYGSTIEQWLAGEDVSILQSDSNGAAIRISPIACLDNELCEVLQMVDENARITHTDESAVNGACALAESIYLARRNTKKSEIKARIEQKYSFDLDFDAHDLYENYCFSTAATATVPIAIWLGLSARNVEHCLRLGLYIGGDTDSILSMATALSASFENAQPPLHLLQQLNKHISINYPDIKDVICH